MEQLLDQDQFYKSIPWLSKLSYNSRFLLQHFLGYGPVLPLLRKWELRTQQTIYQAIIDSSPKQLEMPSLSIETSPSIIRKNYIRRGIPVLIKGGALNWPAYQQWDFDFFKNRYGEHPVILSNHRDLDDAPDLVSQQSTLGKIIEGISENSMKYARFNPLLDSYPELQQQLNQSWLDQVRDTEIKKHHALFIGNTGTKTNIHNAGNDNIFVQIRGKKRWYLWDQRAYYIINPRVNRAPAKASALDPSADNTESCPAFQHLPRYEVLLEPGDIIFVPAYLWHHVENLSPSIGIGNRWLSPRNTINNNMLFAFLELFNTSPTIFETLDWRKGFDFNKIMLKNSRK